ncbi:hypothetical protein RHMOL_Rhmol04G0281300 [Rhododendron molle]|uniref:Uncharacterized protein n=1 Tax=Rhododendron molle TaxID=49168 RepID=A0ACC0P587_RHOML|nr:hypothetical protein RHMOL_Rhmol04G0281300 [Rhododendron molle]
MSLMTLCNQELHSLSLNSPVHCLLSRKSMQRSCFCPKTNSTINFSGPLCTKPIHSDLCHHSVVDLELRHLTTSWRRPWWSSASSGSGDGGWLGAFRRM